MRFTWAIELTPDDGGLLVTAPAFPELTTFGADEADARAHARDALEEAIAARIADSRELPAPDGTDENGVPIPLLSGLKAALYARLRTEGITRAELQRRLAWNRESVDRLFRLDHQSRLDQIEAAFQALGQRVADVELVPA